MIKKILFKLFNIPSSLIPWVSHEPVYQSFASANSIPDQSSYSRCAATRYDFDLSELSTQTNDGPVSVTQIYDTSFAFPITRCGSFKLPVLATQTSNFPELATQTSNFPELATQTYDASKLEKETSDVAESTKETIDVSESTKETYDVFISFRGDGTGDDTGDDGIKFASELAKQLAYIRLRSLMSDEGSKFGDDSQNIVKEDAIKNSRYLVVVLTKHYVTSVRCLRELSKIMEYREEDCKEVIIPLFYQDNPACLVKELQDFGERLEDYNKEEGLIKFTKCGSLKTELATKFTRSFSTRKGGLRKKDLSYNSNQLLEEDKPMLLMEFPRWMSTLEAIINLPKTIFVTEDSYEFDIIDKVKEIMNEVKESPNYLVGISPQLHQMDDLLDLDSNDVRLIGIVGMGGIGKTTIAKALYQNLKPKFRNNHCFLRVSTKKLVMSMQEKLLFRLCEKIDTKIKNEDHGAHLIKKCLRSKKVLIVLDGVDERRQIEKLVGSPDWFGLGSRIIITTRNRNLCRQFNYYKDKIFDYDVEFLDHDSAFSLFCMHAFRKDEPPNENFRDLAEEIVRMAEGHPLALIKIGSHLRGKDKGIWEVNFKSLHKLLYEELFHDILETSYEGLDKDSQQVFLDLACFFHYGMSVDRAIEILENFGYKAPYTKLHSLVERGLIQISYDKIQIHSLICSMGQKIARDERPTQTRIWLRQDICFIFHGEWGLKHVQGIVLMNMEEEELILEAKSFTLMTELKLLEINNVRIDEEIPFLSNKLRLLNWDGYPSKCLPSTFQPPSLLELHLHYSQVERLWKGKKEFNWLKEIDVSGSVNLIETPDFSKVPNLQRLILRNCEILCVIHPSITTLKHLLLVDLANCVNLKTFPSKLITSKRLQTLILSNSGIGSFPEIEKPTKSLTELHLDGTLIQDLPLSFGLLTHLTLLNLRDCTNLSSLPRSIQKLISLQTLNLNGCKNLRQIPFTLGEIHSLTMLDIGGTLIDHAPNAITCLSNLETLNCERLSRNIWWSLSDLVGNNGVLPLRDLNLSDCKLEDEDIPDDLNCLSLLEILDLSKNSFVMLKESLTQLINLKALYLNDCINIQPQLLPRLPTSLQYVGGQNSSQHHISQDDEGSYGNKSASPPSNPPNTVTKIENIYEIEIEENSPEGVDNINANRMGKQISQSTDSNFEVSGIHLIEMDEQIEEVDALLDLKESNKVRFVSISGIAGIGKTSIAEVVYSQNVDKFQSSCFLHISERNNLVALQQELLSQLLLKNNIEIRDEDSGAQMIENQMKSRMVLIVLDDINEKRQVEVLAGSPDWFGHGSRVIITTRNREILHQLNYKDKIREYNVKLLSEKGAKLLFCKYAFGSCYFSEDKNELCTEIVQNIGRLPLALILIGSALRNKNKDQWKKVSRILCNVEEDFISTITNKRDSAITYWL